MYVYWTVYDVGNNFVNEVPMYCDFGGSGKKQSEVILNLLSRNSFGSIFRTVADNI